MAQQPPPEPINSAFLDSPRNITVPMWVAASGTSPAARALVEPLIAGAMRVHGDQAPTLDREFLAWWLNVRRHDKQLQPALDELTGIGFLVIYDGGVNAKTGKRLKRRDAQGRVLPDVYAVRPEPPTGYRGPLNLTDAYEAFRQDRDAAYEHREQSGKRGGVVSIVRTQFGTLDEFPQVTSTPPVEGAATPPAKGVDPIESEFPQVTSTPPVEGAATPPAKGVGAFPQVRSTPLTGGAYRYRDISDISVGEISEMSEGAAAPSADADAAAPHFVDGDDWARYLVQQLPWKKKRAEPKRGEARRLAALFRRAVVEDGWTQDDVREYALDRLQAANPVAASGSSERSGNPVAWVTNAFDPNKRRMPGAGFAALHAPEPLSETPIDLPARKNAKNGAHVYVDGSGSLRWSDRTNSGVSDPETGSEGPAAAAPAPDTTPEPRPEVVAARALLAELSDTTGTEIATGRLAGSVAAAISAHGQQHVTDELNTAVTGSSNPAAAIDHCAARMLRTASVN